MSETARAVLELVERSWGELSADDRAVLEGWLRGATSADLFLLLSEARRRWRRPRKSSSQTMQAIREMAEDSEV